MEQIMLNIYHKFERNKTLTAVREGFIILIPLILIRSFLIVMLKFPVNAYQDFLGRQDMHGIVFFLSFLNNVISNYFSLYLAASLGVAFMRQCKRDDRTKLILPFLSGAAFLIGSGFIANPYKNDILGIAGLFSSVVISVIACKFYIWFSNHANEHNKRVEKYVSDELSAMVKSVLPCVVTLSLICICMMLIRMFTGGKTIQMIMEQGVRSFLNLFLSSELLYGIFYVIAVQILWFFGIQGQNALYDISEIHYGRILKLNAVKEQIGVIPEGVVNNTFINTFVFIGGAGATLSVIVLVLFLSKNKSLRGITKIGLVPSLFNVNEIMMFGIPIVFNPLYLFPFIAVPIMNLIVAYFATKLGIIPVLSRELSWTTPVFVSGYQVCGSSVGCLLQMVLLIMDGVIYYPFVKLCDKQQEVNFQFKLEELTNILKDAEEENREVELSGIPGPLGITANVIRSDLKYALKNHTEELFMVYQPQYDREKNCMGAEALIRYIHPQVGFIYPPLIIKLAKEGGFLPELEKFIFHSACSMLHSLKQSNRENYKISVNITGESLENPDFEKMVISETDRFQIRPSQLWLEITEQDALASSGENVDKLMRLKNRGHKLLIDDFGMGHTSINYLQTNLFDVVKLDGSITRHIVDNARNSGIVSSIVYLGNNLHFDIIAEYVSNEEQMNFLKELGCGYFQGYLLSKPVAETKFLKMS